MDLSLDTILTAGGLTVTAGLVTGLIALIKNAGPLGAWVDANNESLVAYALSAILVMLATFSAVSADDSNRNIGFAFQAFLAWFGIAKLSGGIHDVVAKKDPFA